MSDSRMTLECPLCGASASLNGDDYATHPTVVWLGQHMLDQHPDQVKPWESATA